MKLYNSELKRYLEEYISLGTRIGYFDYNMGKEFRDKLSNFDIEFDSSLPGDAFCNQNKLTINDNIFRKGEEYASLTLFHEFSHICSNLNNDIFSDENTSLIKKLKKHANSYINTNYTHGFSTTKMNDTNNPFTYIIFGALVIDEVTAENIATEMVKMKYNKSVPLKSNERNFGNKTIYYQTHFNYYGIAENLVDDFSKTLFLKNHCKNLNGLCREIFKKNFVYDLIHQHYEKPYAFSNLIEELALLGVMGFSEEQFEGRYQNREKISDDLVYQSYFRLKELLRNGREEREFMPDNIPLPSFMV